MQISGCVGFLRPRKIKVLTCGRTFLIWSGIRGNEIADGFLGPEPALGVSRRDLQKRLGRWLVNQHGAQWRGLGDTQRQAREFISGPSLVTRAKFFTFNMTQSGAATGLLMGHNTLRRHIYLLGLLDSPLYRKSAGWERKPQPMFFVSTRLWPLSDMHIWAPFSWSQRILRV